MPTKSKTSVASRSITANRKAGSRKRHSPAEWTKLLREQRRSGLTVDAFCKAHRLAKSTYWYWRSRLEVLPTDEVKAVAAPGFIAIRMNAASEAFEVQVGEMRVRLDGVAAQRVLEAIVARIAGAA